MAGQDAALAPPPRLAGRLRDRSICVCAGAGGVGKTTIAAALGLRLASEGQRVAVVTIDPARRLATALGLEELGGEPHRIALRGSDGEDVPAGQLWAMMLDPKQTFDELIGRLAPDESTRAQVLANRVYRELSMGLAGSQEFSAIAKLHELHSQGRFDTIVLDTPPANETLDFLQAPARITRFIEGRALAALLAPAGLSARLLGRRGSGILSATFESLIGIDLVGELSRFFGALGGMLDGFHEQVRAVERLLRDPATAFLIITAPEREPMRTARDFAAQLEAAGIRRAAVIVNGVHTDGLESHTPAASEALLRSRLGERLGSLLARNLTDFDTLARRDAEMLEALARDLQEREPIVVSRLDGDLENLGGLERIAAELFS